MALESGSTFELTKLHFALNIVPRKSKYICDWRPEHSVCIAKAEFWISQK